MTFYSFSFGCKYVKDHVWQIIHFAWSINQTNKSGVSNEGQAAHHSFLNGTFFFFCPIIYCFTSLHTGRHLAVFQRGFIFQHTFVRELLLGNVLFKTEIFVQTWSVIIGCANFEENNGEHFWRSLRSDFSSVIHFPHAMLTCQSIRSFFFLFFLTCVVQYHHSKIISQGIRTFV